MNAVLRLHLPGMQKVPLVAHDDDRDLRVRVDLPDMLVKGADGQEAVVVCDGVDQQKALCPLHTFGQAVDHLGEVILDLREQREPGSREP